MPPDSSADRIILDLEEGGCPLIDVPAPRWIQFASTIEDIPLEELEGIVRQYGRDATLARYRWNRAHAGPSNVFDLWSDIIALVSRMDDTALTVPTGRDLLDTVCQIQGEINGLRARQRDLLDRAWSWAWEHDRVLYDKIHALHGTVLLLDEGHDTFDGQIQAIVTHEDKPYRD